MKAILSIAITLLFAIPLQAQDYYKRFQNLLNNRDTAAQRTLLHEWGKKDSNDPEFYTCYFNYYVLKSMSEGIRIGDNPGTGESLQLTDSANQLVGYLYGETRYNSDLNLGFEVIDIGIAKFPNRLDMRFGKIHMLGQVENWDAFTEEIVKTIEYSAKNNDKWEWTLNEAVEDKVFLLESIQTYVGNLFDHGEGQAKNIRRIAETTLKLYPDHVVSLSNLAISYIFENNYSKALEPLLIAEKKAPEDSIILGNIAHSYLNLNNNKKAIEYYEKVVKFGDEGAKRYAEQQIKKLKG
jgi:tetratricopeptide (TPR) repeat protein